MKNIPILWKLMLVVAVMAAITAIVSGIAYSNIGKLSAAAENIDHASQRALLSARMRQNAIIIDRAEYRVSSDPSAETLKAANGVIDTNELLFTEQMSALKKAAEKDLLGKTAGKDLLALIAETEGKYAKYLVLVHDTLAKAKELGAQTQDDAARKAIRELVATSRAEANLLEDAVKAQADFSSNNAQKMADAASELASSTQLVMIIIALVGTLGGIAMGYLIGNFGIVQPVATAVKSLRVLAEGNTDAAIFGVDRKDEIGLIAETMQVFKDNMVRNRKMEIEVKEAEIRNATERKQAMNKMADDFEASVMGVVKAVSSSATEMQTTAQSMSSAAQQASSQATTVATAAEQATSNVQTVATAAEELAASISEISRQVCEAATISSAASEEANNTTAIVVALSSAADKIGEVVKLINDIASQTNLLALNATIEAARAGDAGKGFAVVANEVKSLANQTGRATDEIGSQISAVQDEVRKVVGAIGKIGSTIEQVQQISSGIASAVEEQGAATQEIARNVQQAAQGTQDVSGNIGGVTEAANSTGVAAEQVLRSAGELAQNSERLRREVGNFLATVRAA